MSVTEIKQKFEQLTSGKQELADNMSVKNKTSIDTSKESNMNSSSSNSSNASKSTDDNSSSTSEKKQETSSERLSEPLTDDNSNSDRYVLFPIKHPDIWDAYKKQESCMWHASEVKFTNKDKEDWDSLTDGERLFVKNVLAFFASSDGIVGENLGTRFLREVKAPEARCFYGFQIMMENIHCVVPETMILTDKGYYTISSMVGQKVNVWNGKEFSTTLVKLTSKDPVKVIKVILSNGIELETTTGHKWIINRNGNDERIETSDLEVGDKLSFYRLPVITQGKDIPNAYTNGMKFASDRINKKETGSTMMFEEIPLNTSLHSKLEWIAGYLDVILLYQKYQQSTNTSGSQVSQETSSQSPRSTQSSTSSQSTRSSTPTVQTVPTVWTIVDEYRVLHKLQLMLHTIGIHTYITRDMTDIYSTASLEINAQVITKLNQLGINFRKASVNVEFNSKTEEKHIYIQDIRDEARYSETYCFNEPKSNRGTFNGIMTGQSEVYSKLIDNYITDPNEKTVLFKAIDNVMCIKQKGEWAQKWIESNESFAIRLIAFAIVEGIFFSGAFCCIFWLCEKGKLPSLRQSNRFISRDEGQHTDFACLLYNSHIKNKLTDQVVHQIFDEAVKIEQSFITESLPCSLIGMNSDLMNEYICYVANRLLEQLGHKPLYKGVTQPFDFMERISLSNKSNFFEEDPTEYQIDVDSSQSNSHGNSQSGGQSNGQSGGQGSSQRVSTSQQEKQQKQETPHDVYTGGASLSKEQEKTQPANKLTKLLNISDLDLDSIDMSF